jgi:heterodisulfide reductase subunit A
MIQASCVYSAEEGMIVETKSDRVIRARKMVIELLLARCPDSEEIQKWAARLGVTQTRLKKKNEDCTLCGLCVRMCHERMGVGAVGFVNRGYKREVKPPFEVPGDICQTCGACAFICPTGRIQLSEISKNTPIPIPFEHNQGLISRPPISIAYPQAVPNKPSIDPRYCVHKLRDKCEICKEFCEADAIDYDQEDTEIDLNVGSVILSPGFELFHANTKLEFGYWNYPNVITALEFERILSASGPFEGHVLRPSDNTPPKSIAFIQCVASRDKERNYCSSICCMYATKEAIIAKEHSEEELECHVFYMDVRAFGKGFEQYYERAKELGIEYIRCRPSAIEEIENNRLRIHYMNESGNLLTEDYDVVVLSMGMGIPNELKATSEKLGIRLNDLGFCWTDPFRPVESSREGVFVCGPFTEPKDIPETVTQASGAASKARSLLSEVSGTLITPKVFPSEKNVLGKPPRIGIFICHCGRNIAGVINVPEVVEYAKTLPAVIHAEDNLYTCSNDTQNKIRELIEEHNLNRVIVASCTPRTHEPLFRNTIREAGLNPYLFEMANIRDQCSWVHMKEPEEATKKTKDLIRIAVGKARHLEPLYSISMPINSGVLVLGGGIAGMTAALTLADQGFEVNLVEKEHELGGNMRYVYYLLGRDDDPHNELEHIIDRIHDHPGITVWTGSRVEAVEGFVGNFQTRIGHNGTQTEIIHGVAVVATGAREHSISEYNYGQDERIITQRQLEESLAGGRLDAKRVVMIQCVGSREGDRMYCSRICCSQAVKNALRIKDKHPETDVFVLFREMRSYGFRERYYTEARNRGVRFVRYDLDHKPAVLTNGSRLRIEVLDPILDEALQIDSDLLVLAPALVPQDDAETIAKMLKLPLTKEGFFLEAHMKLRPVDFSVSGVFLAGMAHSPKNMEESIAQAEAAASRALTVISKPDYTPEAIVSSVDEDVCAGCGLCVKICSYDAPEIMTVRGKKISQINQALCEACGACASACPSGAVQQLGFKAKQLTEMISVALE